MNVTLSGVDEWTTHADMDKLQRAGAELGVLYTHSPDGRNRYPSIRWIEKVLRGLGGRIALHICGGRARAQLHAGELNYLIDSVNRVQVNGVLEPAELLQICQRYLTKRIITQHNSRNLWLLPVQADNHEILVDGSGGQGKIPERWGRPMTPKHVGFAGGLGPTTLADELPTIQAVAGEDFWIDMEGGLRDENDWFNGERANTVLEILERLERGRE